MLDIVQPVAVVEEIAVIEKVVVVEEVAGKIVEAVVEEVVVVEEVKEVVPEKEYTRLEQDFLDIEANPMEHVRLESKLAKANKEWTIKIKGPDGTVYEGSVFKFVLTFSAAYP